MKLNLPIIGELEQAKTHNKTSLSYKEVKDKAKTATGGFLDFSTKDLVDETQVSSKSAGSQQRLGISQQ